MNVYFMIIYKGNRNKMKVYFMIIYKGNIDKMNVHFMIIYKRKCIQDVRLFYDKQRK